MTRTATGTASRHGRRTPPTRRRATRASAAPSTPETASDDVVLGTCAGRGEPVDGEAGHVDRRRVAEDEVAEHLADGGPLQEAVPGEPGGVEEPPEARGLADERVVVGCHLVEPGPAVRDPHV